MRFKKYRKSILTRAPNNQAFGDISSHSSSNHSLSYINNDLDTLPLVSSQASAGIWTLYQRDYLLWNTGWAKLAEVIEAYQARDMVSKQQLNIGIAKGGTLEVVNSRTALVVSKEWVDSGARPAWSIRDSCR